MKLSDFDYNLPDALIARYPAEKRSASRLMVIERDTEKISHQHFYDLPGFLNPGDLLVFNNSKVIPARLYGQKPTGGKVEILIERVLSDTEALAHVKASHLKVGHRIQVAERVEFEVLEHERFYKLKLLQHDKATNLLNVLNQHGHMPLPPYMNRPDEKMDQERYQTVYAKHEGSVAAPTAGLHFDAEVLAALAAKGVKTAYVTLHVGAGTFQPVKAENITEHQMHGELFSISTATQELIRQAQAHGKRVIAVGTTSVRVLESWALYAKSEGETHIFIYPGFKFKVVDAMLTNFHLPKSSLLMLISAFATRELMLHAYQLAIAERYRFFSFGDAMFLK